MIARKAQGGQLHNTVPRCTALHVNRHLKVTLRALTKNNDVPQITCHSLRHSFATTAIRSGAPVELVSKMLGHTNITTTYNRYVKPLQNDLNDAVEILNRAYTEAI
jgi:integrase